MTFAWLAPWAKVPDTEPLIVTSPYTPFLNLLVCNAATGQWREALEHGHGQCVTADGATYDGEWKLGSR